MRISLQLIKGDVRDVDDIDCLMFGRRCPLRAIVTEETGEAFVRKQDKTTRIPFPFEILHSRDYRWARVLAVDFRSHNKVTTTQFLGIYLSLLYAIRKTRQGGSIALMPFSARNPDYVALGTIYALWLAAYNRSDPWWGYQQAQRGDVRFKIISDDGIEPYARVLAKGCRLMWDFLESVRRRQDVLPRYVGIFPLQRLDGASPTGTMKNTVYFHVEQFGV